MPEAPIHCPFCERTFHWGEDGDSPAVVAMGKAWESCRNNAFWKMTFHVNATHPDKLMDCPRREPGPFTQNDYRDYWQLRATGGGEPKRCCSYCGSLHPEEFMAAAASGAKITPTDKSYKVYVDGVGSGKFYFQHLPKEDRQKFIDLHNAKSVALGFPGHFYVTPYFAEVAPTDAARSASDSAKE